MKIRRRLFHGFTGIVLGVVLTCAGCGAGVSDTVEADAGEFNVENVNQLTPGDAPAMQRLSAEIKGKPEASTYIVKWKNAHALGSTFRRQYVYDRKAGTLTDSSNNHPIYYDGVKEEFIHSLAQSSGTADGLPALGARKVESLPEPK